MKEDYNIVRKQKLLSEKKESPSSDKQIMTTKFNK